MLFLTRKNGQEIVLNPDTDREIVIRMICNSHPDLEVGIGIRAPEDVPIVREELTRKTSFRENRKKNRSLVAPYR